MISLYKSVNRATIVVGDYPLFCVMLFGRPRGFPLILLVALASIRFDLLVNFGIINLARCGLSDANLEVLFSEGDNDEIN